MSTGSVYTGTASAYGSGAYGYGISGNAMHKTARGTAMYAPE